MTPLCPLHLAPSSLPQSHLSQPKQTSQIIDFCSNPNVKQMGVGKSLSLHVQQNEKTLRKWRMFTFLNIRRIVTKRPLVTSLSLLSAIPTLSWHLVSAQLIFSQPGRESSETPRWLCQMFKFGVVCLWLVWINNRILWRNFSIFTFKHSHHLTQQDFKSLKENIYFVKLKKLF